MSDPNSPPIEKSGNTAAQGRRGTRTFVILVISTVSLVVLYFILYLVFGAHTAKHIGGGGQSGTDAHAAANAFHTSPPTPVPGPPPATLKEQQSATH